MGNIYSELFKRINNSNDLVSYDPIKKPMRKCWFYCCNCCPSMCCYCQNIKRTNKHNQTSSLL